MDNFGYSELYRAVLEKDTLQSLIDYASALTGYSILAADSIHNILALSRDVSAQLGEHVTWRTLLESEYLPSPPDAREASFHMPLPAQIEQPEPIHLNCCLLSDGNYSIMCDLRDQGHIVIKLAIMRVTKNQEDMAFAQILSEVCLFQYYRLLRGNAVSFASGRGQYILSLIHGKPLDTSINAQWLGISAPYLLMVFNKDPEGVVALEFSRMMEEIEQICGYSIKTVTDEEQLLMMFHEPEDLCEFQLRVSDILRRFHRSAGVSRPFSDLKEIRNCFMVTQKLLYAAMDFQGFCRCATEKEFSGFRMFRSLAAQEEAEQLIIPDAWKLSLCDEKNGTHYLETVFVWLYYGKNAAMAAKHIYVHRNTLDNRMSKVSSMVQPQWENGCYCAEMLYSTWYLLRKQGKLQDSFLDREN